MNEKKMITTRDIPRPKIYPVKKAPGKAITTGNFKRIQEALKEGKALSKDDIDAALDKFLESGEKQLPVIPSKGQTEAAEGVGLGKCGAKRLDGKPCKLPARANGFCHIHNPEG